MREKIITIIADLKRHAAQNLADSKEYSAHNLIADAAHARGVAGEQIRMIKLLTVALDN